MRINSPGELQTRIAQFRALYRLHGLATRGSQARLAEEPFNSQGKLRARCGNLLAPANLIRLEALVHLVRFVFGGMSVHHLSDST